MQGLFLTFEGIDGSGKSTQIELLGKWLEATGYSVLYTREPGGSHLGARIRNLLLDPHLEDAPSLQSEIFLFMADRNHHVERIIRPALEEGRIVISDRYTDSTLVYQGYGRGYDLETLKQLNRIATGGLLPRLTFVLDLDPETARLRRQKAGGEDDRMEREVEDFHRRLQRGYLELAQAEPERFVLLSGAHSTDRIQQEIRLAVEQRLPEVSHA